MIVFATISSASMSGYKSGRGNTLACAEMDLPPGLVQEVIAKCAVESFYLIAPEDNLFPLAEKKMMKDEKNKLK